MSSDINKLVPWCTDVSTTVWHPLHHTTCLILQVCRRGYPATTMFHLYIDWYKTSLPICHKFLEDSSICSVCRTFWLGVNDAICYSPGQIGDKLMRNYWTSWCGDETYFRVFIFSVLSGTFLKQQVPRH